MTKTLHSKIEAALVRNTLGISTHEPGMKNIIINLEEAISALERLVVEGKIEELETIIGIQRGSGITKAFTHIVSRLEELKKAKEV